MKKDYESHHLGTISVRMSFSMIESLDLESGKGKKFRDRSDALRSYISLGQQVQDMLNIYSDPEKKKEFEAKFANLLLEKDVDKTLETMEPDQLSVVIFMAKSLKDKKVQLLLDQIKSS